ncbi:hypothetical protein [uncultured Actinomyces sp.]|uniref:hypothetical protein n=1 Tax=uncultured Actinomyces sp. TaxID=249061 RepID=UPI00262C29A9|nr:hypothetical protein [uncultured Actinomyces sp.]
MRRVRGCLSALVIVVALVATVSCARSGNDDERHLWWDGSAPFKERQSIQAYQEVVEARMGEYVTLVKANSGPIVVRVPSIIVSCRGGYEMTTAIVAFGMPVDGAWAKALAKEMFAEVGLTTITNDDEDGMFLHDETNGGFVNFGLNGDRGVALYATSGCRPSRDGTDPRTTRTRPQWETDIPRYRPPTTTPTPPKAGPTPATPTTPAVSPTPG